MAAVQAMTGTGGWPLSLFLTPERKPFFGGTYFPPEDRWGRPGFRTVLASISKAWKEQPARIEDSAGEMLRHLEALSRGLPGGERGAETPPSMEIRADPRRGTGGFGGARSFSAMRLEFRSAGRSWATRPREMVETTLEKRPPAAVRPDRRRLPPYSVDERWLVPHFEKMLYDNAMLARVYLLAARAHDREDFRRSPARRLDYLQREMTLPAGVLRRAGRGFGWPRGRSTSGIRTRCARRRARSGADRLRPVRHHAGGKFRRRRNGPLGRPIGRRSPASSTAPSTRRRHPRGGASEDGCPGPARCSGRGRQAPDRLTPSRSPPRSRKACGEPRYEQAARECGSDPRSLSERRRSSIAGPMEGRHPRLFDRLRLHDRGAPDLYAPQTAPLRRGGGAEAELIALPTRGAGAPRRRARGDSAPARFYDLRAVPSANSVSASNLLRLASFTGEGRYRERAEAIFAACSGYLERAPLALPRMLGALDFATGRPPEIVLAGTPGSADFEALRDAADRSRQLNRVPRSRGAGPRRSVPLPRPRRAEGGLRRLCAATPPAALRSPTRRARRRRSMPETNPALPRRREGEPPLRRGEGPASRSCSFLRAPPSPSPSGCSEGGPAARARASPASPAPRPGPHPRLRPHRNAPARRGMRPAARPNIRASQRGCDCRGRTLQDYLDRGGGARSSRRVSCELD
jgi:hypothetical protein